MRFDTIFWNGTDGFIAATMLFRIYGTKLKYFCFSKKVPRLENKKILIVCNGKNLTRSLLSYKAKNITNKYMTCTSDRRVCYLKMIDEYFSPLRFDNYDFLQNISEDYIAAMKELKQKYWNNLSEMYYHFPCDQFILESVSRYQITPFVPQKRLMCDKKCYNVLIINKIPDRKIAKNICDMRNVDILVEIAVISENVQVTITSKKKLDTLVKAYRKNTVWTDNQNSMIVVIKKQKCMEKCVNDFLFIK